MALIRCADCGHIVSDLAVACPQCARPVAASIAQGAAMHLVSGEGRSARSPKKLELPANPLEWPPPDAVPKRLEEGQVAPVPGSTGEKKEKRCLQCDRNVALDAFRARAGSGGYLCSDCQDEKVRVKLRRRNRVRRLLRILALVAVFGALTSVALYVANNNPWPRATRR